MPHTETYIDGIWYPSVTTILNVKPKPWLNAWYMKWGSKAARKTALANEIGTAFHKEVEKYINVGEYARESQKVYRRIYGMMVSFRDWAINADGIIDQTELKVISRLYRYSGTLDAVGTFEGTPTVFDWKTSSRIYDDMDLQLAAYAQAYKEMTGIDIKQGMIVHVSKDKPSFKLTTKTFKLGKRVFNKFLKLRGQFDEIQRRDDAESIVNEETGY